MKPPKAKERAGVYRLGIALRRYRAMGELDLRTLAAQIGIGHATLMRIEHGHECDAATFVKIMRWLMEGE